MVRFLVDRLLSLVPVLALVLVVIFSLARIIPGDPAVTLLGPGANQEQISALRLQLHLDQPVTQQFLSYVTGLAHGDMGRSVKSGRPVFEEIMRRLPATLELSVMAMLMAIVVGIPIGVFSAVRANSWFDHLVRGISLVGVSTPAFLLALNHQLCFGIYMGWLPISGQTSSFIFTERVTGFALIDSLIAKDPPALWDAFLHLLLPTTVLAAFLAATIARFVRNSMLEVMGQDFIRTARAKGLSRYTVIFRHGLRNSLLAAITVIGMKFAEMLGGAILTETVFAWPGVGRFMFEAIKNRDYPVIQGATLVFAAMFVLTSLLVDLLYGRLDPRIRKKMQ